MSFWVYFITTQYITFIHCNMRVRRDFKKFRVLKLLRETCSALLLLYLKSDIWVWNLYHQGPSSLSKSSGQKANITLRHGPFTIVHSEGYSGCPIWFVHYTSRALDYNCQYSVLVQLLCLFWHHFCICN